MGKRFHEGKGEGFCAGCGIPGKRGSWLRQVEGAGWDARRGRCPRFSVHAGVGPAETAAGAGVTPFRAAGRLRQRRAARHAGHKGVRRRIYRPDG